MKNSKKVNKLWGSAFKESPSDELIAFTGGRDILGTKAVDYKLLPYDIWGSKVHCVMLLKQGIIKKADAQKILSGLINIDAAVKIGEFDLDPQKEDVHTNIESALTEKYGIDFAGKLHTARSRNDQTNLDTRLYLKDQVILFTQKIADLSECLIKQAKIYKETPIPGFTHHQHAMVTTFGHILMAFATMTSRDAKRLTNWINLYNSNPLGSAASYGTSFPIDQKLTASLLGFNGVDKNSLDFITNRWEPEAELAFAIATFMNHLSIIAETLILFSTPEFGMVKLADKYSTGSSMMPQKKNPDPLEIIKAKAALASGTVSSLLGIGKGMMIGYNRDSQWTKYLITDLIDECAFAPSIMTGILSTLNVNKEKMLYWSEKGFIGATSLLEKISFTYNIPFRKAKILIEKAIKYSKNEDNVDFPALAKAMTEEGLNFSISKEEVERWQTPLYVLSVTSSLGGPGLKSIQISISELEKEITGIKKWITNVIDQKEKAKILLKQQIKDILGGGEK
jgi:argininosuccinate lyase